MKDYGYMLKRITEICDELRFIDYKSLIDTAINELSISTSIKPTDIEYLYEIKDLIINIMEYLDK